MAWTGARGIGPDREVGETNHRVVPARGEFNLFEFLESFIDVWLIWNKVEPWMSAHSGILQRWPSYTRGVRYHRPSSRTIAITVAKIRNVTKAPPEIAAVITYLRP